MLHVRNSSTDAPDSVFKTSRIGAALEEQVIALTEIEDEVFKTEALGKGIAIEPSRGEVTAPFDGIVITVADTLHAVGLQSEDGVELLIHVGMDTVALDGKGYEAKVEEGQKIKKGQLLLTFDMKAIQDAGYKLTTPMIVTNTNDYQAVKQIGFGKGSRCHASEGRMFRSREVALGKANGGEAPQYYVEGSHDAIIEPAEWQLVQTEIQRRKNMGRSHNCCSPFSAKLKCGDCGKDFGSKVRHSNRVVFTFRNGVEVGTEI